MFGMASFKWREVHDILEWHTLQYITLQAYHI